MGLFTPKLPQHELQHIQAIMGQLQDSVKLVNTTTKPDVFFKRLNFTLDILLYLQSYERYKIFRSSLPSKDYQNIIRNLEAIVNDFIDRAVAANERKVLALKTEKARKRNREDFTIKLISAFDCANSFWSGSIGQTRYYPHYTGPLFTRNNYQRVQAIYHSLDDE